MPSCLPFLALSVTMPVWFLSDQHWMTSLLHYGRYKKKLFNQLNCLREHKIYGTQGTSKFSFRMRAFIHPATYVECWWLSRNNSEKIWDCVGRYRVTRDHDYFWIETAGVVVCPREHIDLRNCKKLSVTGA